MLKFEYPLTSKKSKNVLKLIRENENVWIKECLIDDSKREFVEELINMLKIAFNKTKEDGGKYFTQHVTKKEWEGFFEYDEKWKLINITNDEYKIQCDIRNATKCLIDHFFENKKSNYFFESNKSNNMLKLIKNNENKMWIDEYFIDKSKKEFTDEFFDMLKMAFEKAKKDGIKCFAQLVSKKEWEIYFKENKNWVFIKDISKDNIEIQCDIENAYENICSQFIFLKYLNKEYFYESKTSENIVKLIIDKESNVWIEKYYIDHSTKETIEEFCKMLNNAFDEAKKNGAEFHSQYVEKIEWETNFKNDDRWDLVESKDDICHIQCDIDDAVECILESFLGKQ